MKNKTLINKNNFDIQYLLKVVAIVTIFIILSIFIIGPILTMLFKLNIEDIKFVFNDKNFFKALTNSLVVSLSSAFITTLLATITAYFLNKANIKFKSIFVLLLTLPMLIPTISIGLGIRLLFGTNGYLDKIFGINFDAVGNYFGLILGSVVVSFPFSFLLIYDALRYENKNVYDACETLGISKFSSFFKITLPYLIGPLISTFFASFTLTFSDYGIPMEIAGKINTLPMYLYKTIESRFHGRLAIIGLIMIIPALIAFIFDFFVKTQSEEETNKQLIKPSKIFNIFVSIGLAIFSFLILLPQISFVITSFVSRYPNDLTFTFEHIKKVFSTSITVGVGKGLLNSLTMSIFTALFGTMIAYISAYMGSRCNTKLGKPLHLVSTSSLAIPGLVLGVGFLSMFSSTNGWFYNTMSILVVVNVFHFFTTPYLMARNAMLKVNKNFETVGDTLGISNTSIFFKVIVPNTVSTIIQMFSYFFMNSMITISAVALLYSFDNKPLAIFINDYTYKDQQYENAAVISLILLISNGAFKGISDLIIYRINKHNKKMEENIMELNHYEFDILSYIERKGPIVLTQRQLADAIRISLGNVNKIIRNFVDLDLLNIKENKEMSITDKGLKLLEPYRVKRAIIVAAGFGHRLAPVTLETPKPLVKVNGRRMIDSVIDALVGAGINDITVVRGYKKEKFDILLEKYPFIKFLDNDIYNECNSIASVYKARDLLDRCYICDADLNIMNPSIITKYQYSTCYYGARVKETDDWCLYKSGNYISKVAIGGEDCHLMIGISYWNEKDSNELKKDIEKVFNSHGGHEQYWDNVPLKIYKKKYKIEIRDCFPKEIVEIDTFNELCDIDDSYSNLK